MGVTVHKSKVIPTSAPLLARILDYLSRQSWVRATGEEATTRVQRMREKMRDAMAGMPIGAEGFQKAVRRIRGKGK